MVVGENIFFQRDFDAEIEAEEEALLAVAEEVAFTQAELDLARHEAMEQGRSAGFEEGRLSGISEARGEIAARHAEAVKSLLVEISGLTRSHREHQLRLEDDMSAFIKDVFDRVFPELIRLYGERRVTEELSRIVGRAVGSPYLEITLSSQSVPAVEAALAGLEREEGKPPRLIPDDTLSGSEINAVWKDGRSSYAFDAICKNIMSVLDGKKLTL